MARLGELIPSRNMGLFTDHYISIAIFSGTFILSYMLMRYNAKKKGASNLPPGVNSVPIIGSLPFLPMHADLPEYLMKKSKELGPVFSIMFGSRYTVILNGRSVMHEAFIKHSVSFASRPRFYSTKFSNPELKGFLEHRYNPDLKKYQQLALNILKKFGFGQNIMERRILVEVEAFCARVRELNGSAFDPNHLVTGSVLNVIASIILGERYELSSPTLNKLVSDAHDLLFLSIDVGVIDLFPTMRFIPKYRKQLKAFIKKHDEIIEFMQQKIDAGLRNELPESFITHFLSMTEDDFDREQLLFSLRDLYLAGSETTSNTLLWAISILANHQDVQRRLHEEIDSVVSRDRLPSLADRKQLPYVDCAILELMRLETVVPLSLFHETIEDVELSGFFIPRGTTIIPNLWSAHRDDQSWENPETFNPDRFLDSSGKVVRKEEVIPFSLGKRSCLGELLAQQEIFLIFTGILQNFQILPPEGKEQVKCKEIVSITLAPSSYEVRMIPRRK